MHGEGLIGAIVIGLLAGWLGDMIMGRRHGLVVTLVVGLVGSFIGAFLANTFGFAFYGFVGSLIVSTVGAIVLLFLLGLIRRA